MLYRKYSWQEFEADVKALAEKIVAEDFTGIYGIPRGGLVLAVCLSHRLSLTLVTDLADITEKTLVCDDIVATGRIFERLVGRLGFVPHLATLFFVPDSGPQPLATVNYLEDNREVWIVFPWETEISTFS